MKKSILLKNRKENILNIINYEKLLLSAEEWRKILQKFQSTIKNGIPLDRISPYLTPEEISVLSSEDIIYAWGNRDGTKSAWLRMDIGDTVIFYAKGTLVMVGEVYFKKHNPNLALAMWPPDDNGNPWEYTFFLRNLRYISIPIKVFSATVGFLPNFIVQGFTHLKPERIQRIVEQYGSLESMFDIFEDKNSEEIPSLGDRLYVNIPKEIHPLIIESQILTPRIQKETIVKKNGKKKIDYILRNKNNSLTGSKGEEIVLKFEKETLEKNGHKDLADKVTRVSVDDDTLGYDILSFDKTGKEKYIEVKSSTTNNGHVRFFVSLKEYLIGKNNNNYFIYFVESINSEQPKITIINNPMDHSRFNIEPDGYIFEAERTI